MKIVNKVKIPILIVRTLQQKPFVSRITKDLHGEDWDIKLNDA